MGPSKELICSFHFKLSSDKEETQETAQVLSMFDIADFYKRFQELQSTLREFTIVLISLREVGEAMH